MKIYDFGEGEGRQGPRGGRLYQFHCPGCNYGHAFEVTAPVSDKGWTWNGSLEKPTFHPSLLVNADDPSTRCHLFLRDGVIEFLSDCHHELAGQKIELPDLVP